MKKIFISLIIASNILYAGMKQDIDYSEFDKIPKIELAKLMANEMARGVRLPMKLDEITQLTNIYSYDSNIIFRKEIDITNVKIKELWENKKNDVIHYMLKGDSQNICYNPMWKYMIYKRNIIPEFYYTSTDNKPLFHYTVEIEDCRKLK